MRHTNSLPRYAIRGSTIHLPGGEQLHGNGPAGRSSYLCPFRHFRPKRPTRNTKLSLCFSASRGSYTTNSSMTVKRGWELGGWDTHGTRIHGMDWRSATEIPDSRSPPDGRRHARFMFALVRGREPSWPAPRINRSRREEYRICVINAMRHLLSIPCEIIKYCN